MSPTPLYQKERIHQRPVRTAFVVILGLVAVSAALITGYRVKVALEPGIIRTTPEKQMVSVFFPAQNRLIEKKFDVRSNIADPEKAEMIINKLKQGNHLPQGFRLFEAATDTEGIMYLNVSGDVIGNTPATMKEILTVYSIVNSFLATFKDTQRILLLVNGQALYTFQGTLYTYRPIEFNRDLLED